MGKPEAKMQARKMRQRRVRRKVQGTLDRPRLSVFRSARHVYAQIIDDTANRVLVAASSLSNDFLATGQSGGNVVGATLVGQGIMGSQQRKCDGRGVEEIHRWTETR